MKCEYCGEINKRREMKQCPICKNFFCRECWNEPRFDEKVCAICDHAIEMGLENVDVKANTRAHCS